MQKKPTNPTKPQKQHSLLLALEPRLLFDGAALNTAEQVIDAEPQTLDQSTTHSNSDTDRLLQAAAQLNLDHTGERREVLVIDTSIQGWQTLADGAQANVEIVLLNADSKGLEGLNQALAEHDRFDAIHILSHGREGEITLGGISLNLHNLNEHASQWQALGQALTSEGDLLLYGCEVADGAGSAFVSALAELTGADVAASDDITGATALGGDWALEVARGEIEADEPINALARAEFAGVLTTPDIGIIGVYTDGNATTGDAVGWVALNDLTAGDVYYFGSTAYIAASNTFNTGGENLVRFTVPTGGVSAGTVYNFGVGQFPADGSHMAEIVAPTAYSDNTGPLTLSSAGSQIVVFQDDDISDTANFSAIFAVYTRSTNWGYNGTSFNSSDLYPGLTAGVDALALGAGPTLGDEWDNVRYAGSLTGTGAEIHARLQDPSNWQQTNDRPVPETAENILTWVVNNAPIGSTNTAPTASGVPTDITVTEDTASNFDLSAVTFADADGDSLTVTVEASAGTFAASSGGGVTVGGSGSTLTLGGTAAAINTFLDTTSNIQYTGASNASGGNAATFTINAHDGTENPQVGSGNIDITGVNDAPTASGVPSDITVTEDTLSNVDLSAMSFADIDSASITVTLTVSAGTFATPAGGFGVSESLINSGTTITLVGSPVNISTYLNTASNIQYTPASNVNGGNVATITVTANDGDGSGDVAIGTVNIDVTAVNDDPTDASLPSVVTVTEDTQGNIDLGTTVFADIDSASITVTLTASAGTFASPADGSSVGSGVTETLQSATVITLVGSPTDINTYLDTASNIQYTPASNVSGNAAATITVTMNDGDGSGNVTAGTVNINVTAVNDAPTASGIPSDVTVTEDTSSNVDLSAVTFVDVDGNSLMVTLTASAGTWAASTGGGVTVGGSGTGTLTLAGTAANINTYLDTASNVQYTGALNVSGNDAATFTIRANDGSVNPTLGTVNLDITAVNDDPTDASLPSAVTVTEDTQSNIDLGTTVFADIDSASITVTLTASAGTFASPADGSSVGSGVTATLLSATEITLVGSPTDINTYLDTASNIQYTPASNVSGNAAATITVTMNDGDGSGNVTAGTVNINVTAVNDNPTVATLPASVTVTEDTQSNIALGAAAFADVDGDNITVTLTASAGTFASPADGSGVGSGVTETLQSATVITLVGSAADINTYLDTASNIQYTAAANVTGNAAATITVTANDGAGSGDVSLGTVNVNVTAVNDTPVFSNLDGTPAFTEGGAAQILDANVTVSDVELASLNSGNGNFNGAMLVLARNGGVNASDTFSIQTGGNLTVAGSNIAASGNVFATFDTASTVGHVTISFTSANGTTPTTALVNEVMQAIRYANSSNDPAASVQINWTFSDGNSGNAQGTGDNPGTGTGSTTVAVTNVNDAPTLTATGGNPTYTENGAAQDLFNTVTASTVETADRFTSLSLTVTNVSDGASEILSFDGSDVALTHGNTVTTATNSLSVSVAVTGSTATVSFTAATLTSAQMQTLVDGLTYRNSSEAPTTTGNRVVTITGISDNGGTANSGSDSATPNLTSTVTVAALNDTPTLTSFGPDAGNVGYTAGSTTFIAFDYGTVANLQDVELDALNTGAGNYDGATITLARNGVADTSDRFGIAGGTTALDTGATVIVGATNIGAVTAGSAASGTITITLNSSATSALVDTFFQSIGYTNSNGSATGAVTINVTLNDGNTGTQGSGGAQSVTEQVNLTIGNRPVIGNLTGDTAVFTENGGAVIIDQGGDATVTDADSPINLNGGKLSISVTGNANAAQDVLSFSTAGSISLGGTTAGSNVSVSGTVIGTLANNIAAGNTLQVNLNANGTIASVQTLVRTATYHNTSEDPGTSDRTISFVVTDDIGLSSTAATATVSVASVNDAPTLTATGGNPTYTENGAAQDLFNTVTASTVETADRFTSLSLTVTNVSDGASEILSLDGSDVALTDGNSVTTATNNLSVSVAVTGSTATVSFTAATLTSAQMQTLVDGLTYRNSSEAPTITGNRVFTITGISDNGGTANSGSDSATPNLTSTVTVTAVNDAPVNTVPGAQTVIEDTLLTFNGANLVSVADVEGNLASTQLTVNDGNLNVTLSGAAAISAGSNGTSSLTISGTQTDINATLATLTYQGDLHFNGADMLTVVSTDSAGTPLSDSDMVAITVSAANDAPTLGGTPADDTATEDVVTAIDLSAYNVADVEGDALTLTLAVDRGAVASIDGNGTTAGVTIADSGTASMTLTGSAADLNSYLSDTSKITYTTALNDTTAATLSVTPNDGTMNGTADTVNISITAVNDAPTLGGTPADDTATEDVATAIDLSAYTVADAEGDTLTLTLEVDRGAVASTDGNGTAAGVTIADSGSASMTLTGSAADLNSYLSDTSKITYTTALNDTTSAVLTVTPNDGTDDGTADTVNISITPVNDTPTATGVPSDITVTEDLAGDFDLSAVTIADIDGDSLTVTLAASAGTFSASSGGSVIIGGSDTGSLALTGSAADINTYLDTASNIQYTGASNASGDNAAAFTIHANDGTVNPQLGSGNIDITAVNDAPTVTGVPSDVTVTEDTASNFDLSSVTFTDVDGDNLTVTLAASMGTFAASSGGSVTIGGSGSGSLTLSGTAADINTYLDTVSNIQYTGASNASGDNAGTFTIHANDGTVNLQVGSGSIDITAVNDAPTLGGSPADDTAIEDVVTAIDLSAYSVADVEGDALTLTLAVDRGTVASIDGNGTTAGVTVLGSGTGSMSLTGSAADLNSYLSDTSKITYTTALNDTTAATLSVTPNDGTMNGTADTVNISITPVNDTPTVTGVPTDVTVTEDLASNFDLSAVTFADVDGDSLTVTLAASMGTFAASSGGSVTIGGSGSGSLTLTGSAADINAYLSTASNIQYTGGANASGNNSATFTINANDGTVNPQLGSGNIDITPVNDAPTVTGVPTDVTVTEDLASNFDLSAVTFADVDGDNLTVTLAASTGTFAASSGGSVTIGGSGSGSLTLSGSAADINAYLDTASNIQYTGAANASGDNAATFTIHANDGTVNPQLGSGNIDIAAVNDAPEAVNHSISGVQDTAITGTLGGSDIDNDELMFTLKSAPVNGEVTVNVDGSFSYSAAVGFHGDDGFIYEVSDGHGGSADGTVNISLSPLPPFVPHDLEPLGEVPAKSLSEPIADQRLRNLISEAIEGLSQAEFHLTNNGTIIGYAIQSASWADSPADRPSELVLEVFSRVAAELAQSNALESATIEQATLSGLEAIRALLDGEEADANSPLDKPSLNHLLDQLYRLLGQSSALDGTPLTETEQLLMATADVVWKSSAEEQDEALTGFAGELVAADAILEQTQQLKRAVGHLAAL